MPDDEIIEESPEQEEEDFNAITDESLDTPEPEVKPEVVEDELKPEKEPEPDKDEEDTEDKEPDGEPEEELSVEETIKARAEEIRTARPPEPDKEPEKDKEPEREPEPAVDSDGPLTKEDVKYLLDFVTSDELPGEMTIGDDDLNLKEYGEQYPEELNVTKVVAGVVANKMLGNLLDSGAVVTRQEYQEAEKHIQNMGHVVNQVLYFMNVMGQHQDVLQLNGSKDFTGWLAKQSDDVKALNTTGDYRDAIKVLDYYKETIAKADVIPIDKKAKEKKARKDALHKGTLRQKPDTTPGDKDEDDEEAIFAAVPDD